MAEPRSRALEKEHLCPALLWWEPVPWSNSPIESINSEGERIPPKEMGVLLGRGDARQPTTTRVFSFLLS